MCGPRRRIIFGKRREVAIKDESDKALMTIHIFTNVVLLKHLVLNFYFRAFILSMFLNQRNHLSSSYSHSLSFVLTHPGVSE